MECAVEHKGTLAEKKDNPMMSLFFKWAITRKGASWGWQTWQRHHCCQCREGRSVKLWSLHGHILWPTPSLIQMLQSKDVAYEEIRHLRQCSLLTWTESSPQENESIPEPAWVQRIVRRKWLKDPVLTWPPQRRKPNGKCLPVKAFHTREKYVCGSFATFENFYEHVIPC